MSGKLRYRRKVIHALFQYATGVKRYFVLLIACTALNMILDFVNPMFYKLFIDEVIMNKSFEMMKWVAAGYLGVFLAGAFTLYAKKNAEYRFIHKVLFEIKNKIFGVYLGMSFDEYDNNAVGDMKLRIEDDTRTVRDYTGTQTIEYGIAFITMTASGIMLFVTDWRLAIFSVLVIPATFLIDDVISRHEKRINNVKRENDKLMTSWLKNSLQGWREVRALNLGKSQLRRFVRYMHAAAKCNSVWINCWTARVLVVPKIKDEFLMRFGLYFMGGLLIAKGKLSISDLLVFIVYYEMMAESMKKVSSADAELQANMPMTDRFMEELSAAQNAPTWRFNEKQEKVTKKAACPDRFTGIDLKDVTFAYKGMTDEVLKGFNLSIKPGERVGITGKSGSGKSTILKLIMGMLTPLSGGVYFSGVNVRDIELDGMYRKIGYVMQDNILFHASIRENLRYGKPDATDEEMLEACKMACIYDFINELPHGLDTIIGEKGLKLSGGQRQRLVLARMFLQDVEVYIFDEATSALDADNEELIQETLGRLAEDKTLIVVAHRESSLRLCDRIVQIT